MVYFLSADYLIQNDIAGNLIKIGGSEEDPIFDKKNVFFKKDAKAVGNDFNDVSVMRSQTIKDLFGKL